MRVKKFEAKNMKEALQMVKKHLGPDAVILSARDNRKNFGLGGEPSVEITAAVSESTLQKKQFTESRMTNQAREKFQNTDARTQRAIIEKMVENRLREQKASPPPPERRSITKTSYIDIPDETPVEATPRRQHAFEHAAGRNVRELLEDIEENEPWQQANVHRMAQQKPPQGRVAAQAAPSKQMAQAAPSKQMAQAAPNRQAVSAQPVPQAQPPAPVSERALARIRNAAKEAFAASGFAPAENAHPAPSAPVGGMDLVQIAQAPEIASLKNEIGRLQQLLEGFQKVPQSFVAMHPGADFGIPYDLSFMFQKLTDSGVTIDNTVDILTRAAKEIDPVSQKKRPIVDAWVARWFLDNTHINTAPFQGRVHAFVGGAGSGKTSQLVKIASHLVVKERKKVAVLSTDSFKVGAVDQLKIYCQILNVPFAVIRNRKDWEWVLGQMHSVDHVLVDFPGLQLRDLDEIHMLKSLMPPAEAQAVSHFCVAATTKDGDAYEIARRYRVADYQDLIVTNLDQSVQHGIITNLQLRAQKPLHSFGIGSRLPEDFELASKERVLDLIFKLTKLRKA